MGESHKTSHISSQNQKKKRNRIMLKPVLEPPKTVTFEYIVENCYFHDNKAQFAVMQKIKYEKI